jgi:ABC-2 type transport system ATP-binding protein
MATPELAVDLRALAKDYGGRVGLAGLDLAVRRGEIFGLIGPDGAGKTTAIRILCGILSASGGAATVLGTDVLADPETVKKRIGYLSQRFSLYQDLTVAENMTFFADLFQVAPAERAKRQEELLAFSRLGPFQDRLAGALSGGMKQKLGVSCALIHTPDLLVLDEPTTGVDPVSRRELWALLYRLWQDGLTILLTTPYLDEAERCTRVGLIDRGRMLVVGAPDDLKRAFPETVYEVHGVVRHTAEEAMRGFRGLSRFEVFGDRLHAVGAAGLEGAMAAHLTRAGLQPAVRVIPPTMEDLYFHYLARREDA